MSKRTDPRFRPGHQPRADRLEQSLADVGQLIRVLRDDGLSPIGYDHGEGETWATVRIDPPPRDHPVRENVLATTPRRTDAGCETTRTVAMGGCLVEWADRFPDGLARRGRQYQVPTAKGGDHGSR